MRLHGAIRRSCCSSSSSSRTARLLGLVLRYFGQPPVIGEMAAGFVLGPVVFGALAPELHAHVFREGSSARLTALSQLGLVLFMFIVGAELRTAGRRARQQLAAAGWIGVLSVLVPMALGLRVAPLLYPTLAPPGVAFWPFALFMAAAMSITAFPVMARILKDRQMTQHDHRPPGADRRGSRRRARLDHARAGRRARRQRPATGASFARTVGGPGVLSAC